MNKIHNIGFIYHYRQGQLCQESLNGGDLTNLIREGHWSVNSEAIEHYTRSDFMAMTAYELMRDFPENKRVWTPKRLAYLSENLVETNGATENHPHSAAMDRWCLDKFRRIVYGLPADYPHQYAAQRMQNEMENREKGMFLTPTLPRGMKKVASKAVRIQAGWKAASSSIKNRYKFNMITSKTMAVLLPDESVAQSITVTSQECAAQTDMEYITEQPMFDYYGELKPVHMDALDLIPQNNVFKLVHTESKICLRRKSDEESKKSTEAAVANCTKAKVMEAILMRLSPKARQARADRNDRKGNKKSGSFTPTYILKELQYFFLCKYLTKGEQGLPIMVKEGQQYMPAADFAAFVKESYENKPNNYEQLFQPKLRVTAQARKQRAFQATWEGDVSNKDKGKQTSNKRKRSKARKSGKVKWSRKSTIVSEAIKVPQEEQCECEVMDSAVTTTAGTVQDMKQENDINTS